MNYAGFLHCTTKRIRGSIRRFGNMPCRMRCIGHSRDAGVLRRKRPDGIEPSFPGRESRNFFGVEGFLVMLVGTRYPYRARHAASVQEKQIWN